MQLFYIVIQSVRRLNYMYIFYQSNLILHAPVFDTFIIRLIHVVYQHALYFTRADILTTCNIVFEGGS